MKILHCVPSIVLLFFTFSVQADPKQDCSIALEGLGYSLGAYTFEKAGWISKEKHIFNGTLICYIGRDKKIHSIEDNDVVIAEDGFFGQDALAKRDELNDERKKELKDAKEKMEAELEAKRRQINEKFDAKILKVKQDSGPGASTQTSEVVTPSNSDRAATPSIVISESSPKKGPQTESEPQLHPKPRPATTETNSSDEPVDAFVAHQYKIVETSNSSAGSRQRTRLRIHAPTAATPGALIATAMDAAVHAQDAHQSQYVSVFVHAEDDPGSETLAQVKFAPDGCGISGDECTGDMWSSATAVAEVPNQRQIAIFEAAKRNEDSFKKVVAREIEDDAYDVLMEKVKPLYEELMLMKDDERFRTVGFSTAGPYNRWLLDVQRVRSEADELQLLRNWNISVGELLQLGMDYLDSKGGETQHTQDARERFSLAFTSKRGESKRYERDEEALLKYLAEEFRSNSEEIETTIREAMTAYLDRRSVEIPEHLRSKGALTKEQHEDMTCRMDLQCWGDKHSLEATFACQDHIESLALYTHEWTDGFLEPKFSHFRWSNRTEGIVTYMGDKIMFQNGFGAWVPHRYSCDYDALNKQVLDVQAQSGRM